MYRRLQLSVSSRLISFHLVSYCNHTISANPTLNGTSVNFSCNAGTIIAGNASELKVSCVETNQCNNLTVDCPLNTDDSYNDTTDPQCQLECYNQSSCSNFVMNAHASYTTAIYCGNLFGENDDVIGPICTNGLINGTYDSAQEIPDYQGIGIACISQPNSQEASCVNMS